MHGLDYVKMGGENPSASESKRLVTGQACKTMRHQPELYGAYRTRYKEDEHGYVCQPVQGAGNRCRRAALGHGTAFWDGGSGDVGTAGANR